MPIKLKKTNIQYDIDTPEEGYIILGFDESGNLVTKNEQGNYEPIVSDISTGNFERLQVDFLTVGNRVSGAVEGQYSIAQGLNITADGDSSYAQGNNAKASGLYSYARGEHVEANGERSYVSGKGGSSSTPLVSGGKNSFVHQDSSGSAGSLADYSAILGGQNNDIGTGSNYSAIIGGSNNIMGSSKLNTIFLGCSSVHSTHTIESNTVYVPRLVLTSTSALSRKGSVYFTGTNFYGYDGSSAKRLDMTVTNHGANRLVVGSAVSTLTAQSNLTFNGSTLSVTGSITSTSTISAGSSTISTTGTVSAGTVSATNVDANDIDIAVSTTSTSPLITMSNSSTGDASMSFAAGSDTYTMGIDNTDDDRFKIYYGSSLSTTTTNTVLETNRVAMGADSWVRNDTYMNGRFTMDNNARAAATLEVRHSNGNGDNLPPPFTINRSLVSSSWYLNFQGFYVGSTFMGAIQTHGSGTLPYFIAGSSDIRKKHNINLWDKDALSALSNVDVKTYYTNDDDDANENIGWVAQDLINDIPEMVMETNEAPDDDPDNPYLTIAPSFLTPYFHKAIQQLNNKVKELEQRIYDLENPS